MTTVLTYGTFDLFHVGHVRLFKRLKDLGDRLVVGCSTDDFNRIKGKQTILSCSQRMEIVRSCRYVDDVFPENSWDQKISDIKRENASIFAMGSDWAGKFDELSVHCKVIYLPRTDDISTTEIRQMVSLLNESKKFELINAIDHLSMLIKKL